MDFVLQNIFLFIITLCSFVHKQVRNLTTWAVYIYIYIYIYLHICISAAVNKKGGSQQIRGRGLLSKIGKKSGPRNENRGRREGHQRNQNFGNIPHPSQSK